MIVPPSIILCGASGAGKTTLALEIQQEFGYNYIQVQTRQIENKYGGREKINRDDLTRDMFQKEVAVDTSLRLLNGIVSADKQSFISDRGIDFLMYECLYGNCTHMTVQLQPVKQLIASMAAQTVGVGQKLKVILLTRDDAEKNGQVPWRMPVSHKYYTRQETRRQEISLETILKLHGINYTKIQRCLIPTWIKNPIRNFIREGKSQ